MTVVTKFYFDVESNNAELKIRQKKFIESTYIITEKQTIEYIGMTSWAPASFEISSTGTININNLLFSIDESTVHELNVIYYKINGTKYKPAEFKFNPFTVDSDSVVELRVYFNVLHESTT